MNGFRRSIMPSPGDADIEIVVTGAAGPNGLLNRRKRPRLPNPIESIPEKRLRVTHRADTRSPTPRKNWWELMKATKDLAEYKYTKLQDGQIRIILLQPSDDADSDLKISLVACTVEELDFEFAALSYTWGEGEPDHPVWVEPDEVDAPSQPSAFADVVVTSMRAAQMVRNTRFMIKPNLYAALKHLRTREHEVALWVDAICINQMDNAEKKIQVPRMFQIYSVANLVYVWLGRADKQGRTDEAMKFIPEVVKAVEVDELINDAHLEKWHDLLFLMRSAWFSRRWIIQELALAKKAEVRCGKQSVNWRDFSDAISLFVLHYEQIAELFKRKPEATKDTETITDLNPLGAKILVDELSNTFLRSGLNGKEVFEPMKGLETLVSTLSTFDTSDPRDSIYALLNIARESSRIRPNDTPNPPPEPDYEKNLLQVYNDFVKWVIKETKSIDIICRQWALPERIDNPPASYPRPLCILPSWIKTVPDSAFGRQQEGFSGRKNGESLVGLPGRNLYNASHGKAPSARVDSWKVPTSRAMFPSSDTSVTSQSRVQEHYRAALNVSGIELGVVEDNTDPIADGVIPAWALKKLGWDPDDDAEHHEMVPDSVWRTLVADGDASGQKPPAWYHRACLRCLARDTPNGHLNTRQLLMKTPSLSSICRQYLQRVQAVTWNRVVLQTHGENTVVGIGPPLTRRGDIVCILFGCSVPCILRETRNTPGKLSQENGQTDPMVPNYEFIGEAFIYGKMDGQHIANLSKEDLRTKTREFCLV